MSEGTVKPFSAEQEYFFEEGCFINELVNSADDPVLSIARARVAAGNVTRWHYLRDTTERYVITAGSGVVEVGAAPGVPVATGDVVIIPAGVRQRIRNTGDGDLVFLALCTPRFEPGNYVDCDEKFR